MTDTESLNFIRTSDIYGTMWRVRSGTSIIEVDDTGFSGQAINDIPLVIEHDLGQKAVNVDIDNVLLSSADLRALAAKLNEIADYVDSSPTLRFAPDVKPYDLIWFNPETEQIEKSCVGVMPMGIATEEGVDFYKRSESDEGED